MSPAKSEKQRKFMGALKLALSIYASLVKLAYFLLSIRSKIMKPIGIAMPLSTTLALSFFLSLGKIKNNICLRGFEQKEGSNFFKNTNTMRTRPFNSVGLLSSPFKIARVIAHLPFTSINHLFDGIQKRFLRQRNPNVVFPRLIAFPPYRDSLSVEGNGALPINNSRNISRFFNSHIYSIPQHTHKVKGVMI